MSRLINIHWSQGKTDLKNYRNLRFKKKSCWVDQNVSVDVELFVLLLEYPHTLKNSKLFTYFYIQMQSSKSKL